MRLLYLDDKSLLPDEINMIRFMTGERDLALSFGNALLYVDVLRVASWFGMSDFVFRLPAALLGITTIPLMYATATRLFGRRVGLYSALLLSMAPMHIYNSQYVHGYTAFCFLALLSFFLLWNIYERGTTWDWAAFALVTGIGIQIHLYMLFILTIEGILFLFLVLSKQDAWSLRSVRSYFSKKLLLQMLLALALIFLVALPTFLDYIFPIGVDLIRKMLGYAPEVTYLAQPARITITPRMLGQALKELIVFRAPYTSLLFAASVFLAGAGMVYLLYRERRKGILLLVWMSLPIVPIAIFSQISNLDFGSRRLIFILPMVLMVISVALVKGTDAVVGLLPRLRIKTVSPWMADAGLGLLVFLALSTTLIYYYRFTETYDLKNTCAFLEQQVEPGDLVIGWQPRAHFSYYCSGTLDMIPARTPVEEIQRRYQNGARLWYARSNGVRVNALNDSSHNLHGRYSELEHWLLELEPLEFSFGGGMRITFIRRAPASPRAMLEERAALLENAIRLKPGRAYLHQALASTYQALGRDVEVEKHRVLRDRLVPP